MQEVHSIMPFEITDQLYPELHMPSEADGLLLHLIPQSTIQY